MPKLTEDEVRDKARDTIGLYDSEVAKSGVGQVTTFKQLGIGNYPDKPDGWYLPFKTYETALILETKNTGISLGEHEIYELIKNVQIAMKKYDKVVGILYNGKDLRVLKGTEECTDKVSDKLQSLNYYLDLYKNDKINKRLIYALTAKINNCLHFEFGIKNLYHRMIFTACALVAKRYNAFMEPGMDYSTFHNAILSTLNKELYRDKQQNQKLEILLDVFSEIRMNLNVDTEDEKEGEHVKKLIAQFIGWVSDISKAINSKEWRGEDVMGIFFNEFNRYKKKSEQGQIFTPEHITDFMYRILGVDMNDRVLDATCGSGGFLTKAMANMIREAGGVNTSKANTITKTQLYGIEFDREIYALACANMLIHKDGKTNLQQMDSRTELAGKWIKSKGITKVLMNPPYEKKYGCIKIIKNVMDNLNPGTLCGFILPDKKLEKIGKLQRAGLLADHRLCKIIKLPEDLFFNVGVTTSIFIFQAHKSQINARNEYEPIFTCYMKDDGLVTVKNKGRHDVYNRWEDIENKWVDIVKKQSGDDSCRWIDPSEHLSYQKPVPPFSISSDDFKKTALDYYLYQSNESVEDLKESIVNRVLYQSKITEDKNGLKIEINKNHPGEVNNED